MELATTVTLLLMLVSTLVDVETNAVLLATATDVDDTAVVLEIVELEIAAACAGVRSLAPKMPGALFAGRMVPLA